MKRREIDFGTERVGPAHELPIRLGFEEVDAVEVATAVSELARSMLKHAVEGELFLSASRRQCRLGIQVIATDQGSGISDFTRAMEADYCTTGGLGLGLPEISRLTDDLAIKAKPRKGTKVTMWKWRR